MLKELAAGDIVFSTAGRDEGRYFIVTKVLDAQYVAICDGSLRKSDKPKRKKVKHLKKSGARDELIAQKLAEGQRVTNPDLRRALAKFSERDPQ